MKLEKLTLQILAVTVGCFALSYGAAVVAGVNTQDPYPKSVAKLYMEKSDPLTPVKFEKTISAEKIQELEILSTSYEINLNPVDGNEFQIKLDAKVHNPKNPLDISTDGDRLTIKPTKTERRGFTWDWEGEKGTLTVSVPKKIAKLKIKTVSGDIIMTNFNLDSLEVAAVSGDLNLNGSHVREIEVKTVSGDVMATGVIDRFNGKSVSGDIQVKFENAAPEVEVRTTSGDSKIAFKN
ncbi:MAG TPA: DUF4097 family beta strand repeat-containing protein, partial [Candidatus Baltobacteraceae bacterium]|nr:DUF4097 family beta strand repeat-containing protein [Candidatus Baltobacteraceae bacterium]